MEEATISILAFTKHQPNPPPPQLGIVLLTCGKLTNKKILEELELNKKLLKQGGVPPLSTAPLAAVPGGSLPNLLRDLECCLEEVETFGTRAKIRLEQYPTPAHLAACVLHTIETSFGDISGRLVADLGCGCGNLTVGASLLGAASVVGFDIDPDALQVFESNRHNDFDGLRCPDDVEAVLCDVTSSVISSRWHGVFDTVIMNPPFGTKKKGIDLEFVKVGLQLAPVVYSLHKTSTRNHIVKKFEGRCQVLAQLRFNIDHSYKFHTRDSVDISVDLIKFCKK
ncbi:hypothetical protein AAG570_010942 [Ranatra chinensis]|uniref:Methyltransferase small domain-containing protein n=1 Tax=Ranatra chinensis TaxID=642074 RepID=A0ABD0Z7H3_9HEMI